MNAGIASGAVLLAVLLTGPLHPRVAALRHRAAARDRDIPVLRRLRVPIAALAGAAGWAFVGGLVGGVAGVAVAALAWRTLTSARSPAVIREEARLRVDYPLLVELLARVVGAGADIGTALRQVGDAVGDPWCARVEGWLNALEVGQPAADVWVVVEQDSIAGGLGRALGRSHAIGVPVADAMLRLAQDLRDESDLAAHAYARTIEVRAAVPLGVCFLPAFVLVGVVPLVAGVLGSAAWVTAR